VVRITTVLIVCCPSISLYRALTRAVERVAYICRILLTEGNITNRSACIGGGEEMIDRSYPRDLLTRTEVIPSAVCEARRFHLARVKKMNSMRRERAVLIRVWRWRTKRAVCVAPSMLCFCNCLCVCVCVNSGKN